MNPADQDALRNDLLAAWLEDQAAGRERAVEEYLEQFPGHEALVREELAMLSGEAELPVPPGTPEIEGVELTARIGGGGQGVVYRGRQRFLERDVAVKVLTGSAWSPELSRRFKHEARTLASLEHQHIVGCYDAGVTAGGQGYMVMEFVPGPNLREWLDEQGPMTPPQALRLCRDIAEALQWAHKAGIIHRDVKPENILLDLRPADESEHGLPFTAKLADLGLARASTPLLGEGAQTQLTPVGAILGSPRTMAPEQFDDPAGVDFRADIYGLGCVLFHALAGRPAFSAAGLAAAIKEKVADPLPDLRKLRRDIDPKVAELVQRMLAPKPAARPQSYADLIASLDGLLARPARRPWLGLLFVGLVLLGLLLHFTNPLGLVWGPELEVPPVHGGEAGAVVELVAQGDPGLQYHWREVHDRLQVLDAAQATARVHLPLGLETSYEFEVRASNGWRESRRVTSIHVRGREDLQPLGPGVSKVLLAAEVEKPETAGWQRRGSWGKSAPDDPWLSGYVVDQPVRIWRRLHRGAFRLRGSMAPEEEIPGTSPARLALDLQASPAHHVALELRPAGEEHAACVVCRPGKDGAERVVGEALVGAFGLERRLGFVCDWDGSVLTLRFGPAGEEASWQTRRLDTAARGTRFPPHSVALEVRSGRGFFWPLTQAALPE